LSSPFNERKYRGLLEGLEVSEVKFSDVIKDNYEFRIDSDFFKKEILSVVEFINSKPHDKLKDLISDLKSFGAYSLCNEINFIEKSEQAIPFVRCLNIKNGVVNFDDLLYIDKKSNELLWKSEVKPRMVLVTMSGTVGNATVALENWKYPINTNQDIAKIETSNINPYFLATFLNSKYGYVQMIRLQAGAIQQHLYLSQIEKLVIPKTDIDFQQQIEKTVKLAHSKREQSKSLYRQAEELLLETLGLKDFTPSEKGINIKSFKSSFLATGRLDAEYYQSKYEDYIDLVRNYKNGFELLQTACNLKDSNFTPEETKEYQYIELADIGKSGNITGCTVAHGKELPSRARRKVNANDVIISSIEGSLDSCALVTNEYDNALCSTGFYVVNSEKINSETLLVLFKSEAMQNILKQSCSGTILTAINKTEFQNIPVPIIELETQQQIAALIQQSFDLRGESELLLAEAKEMVEREVKKETIIKKTKHNEYV
jgi:restriction endonuclease S subunit